MLAFIQICDVLHRIMYMHIAYALVHTYAFPLSHILPLTYSFAVSYISPATNVDSEAVLIHVSPS